MRKISEVLRLRFELGLGQRAIARACSISQSTVHEQIGDPTLADGILDRLVHNLMSLWRGESWGVRQRSRGKKAGTRRA
jgi:DNA invertase Pin-like site-specific DNA recombinase